MTFLKLNTVYSWLANFSLLYKQEKLNAALSMNAGDLINTQYTNGKDIFGLLWIDLVIYCYCFWRGNVELASKNIISLRRKRQVFLIDTSPLQKTA